MNLLIFSRTRLFAECLASGLAAHPRVASATGRYDLPQALAEARAAPPTAIVVDLASDGWEAAAAFADACPESAVMGFAVGPSADDFLRCARSGCRGVIPHDASADATVMLIRQALRHEIDCPPGHVAKMMHALHAGARAGPAPLPPCLTRREGQICSLLCGGLTNKEIARELACSEGTVKNHVHAILGKLQVTRRSALPARLRQ